VSPLLERWAPSTPGFAGGPPPRSGEEQKGGLEAEKSAPKSPSPGDPLAVSGL
jgi:hypothetical protein